MLAHTVIYLLIIGLLSLVQIRPRYDRLAAAISTTLVAMVFINFLKDWQSGQEAAFTLLWDSSKSGDIKLDILSVPSNYLMILPFFAITLIALFNNLFFRYETQKRLFSAILALNLVSLILLISGNNFLQIITFVFVIDILSQLLIKDIHASRRYTVYNLVADMGLFLVLAMIHGKLENLDVGNIHRYYETGRHRDFIAAVILISLFIKFGFFLFQSYLLDLKSARFHRLILIPYLSTPMVALILFIKFSPLLVVSSIFFTTLHVAIILTIIWGCIGIILINNLKEKAVYVNMMVIAFLAGLVENNDFQWNMHFSWLLVLGFLFNCCIYYLHYYTNRENSTSFLKNFQYKDSLPVKMVLGVTISIMAAFSVQVCSIYSPQNEPLILCFGLLFTFSAAHMFNQIFRTLGSVLSPHGFDKRPLPVLFAAFCISFGIFYQEYHFWLYALGTVVLFSGWLLIYPLKHFVQNETLNQRLQNVDTFSHWYKTFIVSPIHYSGKFLNVLVDFVFIERTLISAITWFNGSIIRTFRRVNRMGNTRYILSIIAGMAIFAWCFWEHK